MKQLKPLLFKDSYYKGIQKQLDAIFLQLIYQPVMRIISQDIGKSWVGYKNAKDDLYEALQSGRIQYTAPYFEGKFNALISRELKALGAKWTPSKSAFMLPEDKLPMDIKTSIATAQARFKKVNEDIEKYFNELTKTMEAMGDNAAFDFEGLYGKVIGRVEDDFQAIMKNITVTPVLTKQMAENLARGYSYNLNLYIKKWTVESILRLRRQVAENAMYGYRASNLIETIKQDYGVSQNKARFLARQETTLLLSKFRQERFTDAGVEKYRWSTSNDVRVRADHKELNGKIFTWDNPPIVDRATGRRAHAGEDFGCRCVAIPIVD